MKRSELIKALEELNTPKGLICLGGIPNDCFCVKRISHVDKPDTWEVYYSERGKKYDSVLFDCEEDAYDHLFDIVKGIKQRNPRLFDAPKDHKEKLTYIFVHGLSGWGSYDETYRRMPYWGMRGGDLMEYLREQGYSCYAASVAPTGSAWDRACELYAQIAGTRVDYGLAHSSKYGHDQFGRDFTGDALIPEWDENTKLVLLGHSFGGVTARLFAELMANGDQTEKETGIADLSPLFSGGMGDRIHSIVTLAAPTNGTTAYDMFRDPAFKADNVRVPWWSKPMSSMMSRGTRSDADGRDERDTAGYDMHIDRALVINSHIRTMPEVYYFAVPCSFTIKQKDGTHRPKKGMEPLFVMRSCQIGAYTGATNGGTVIGEEWMENDGLVNTVSSMAPMGAPSKPLERGRIEPGIWNVLPTFDGDHMALQGGLTKKHDIKGFYTDLLGMINSLA